MADQGLTDELACARLLVRAGYSLDRNDVEGFVALLTDDAVLEARGASTVGATAIRAALEKRPANRTTRHMLTPPVVELLGPDEARATAFFTFHDGVEDDRLDGELPLRPASSIGEFQQAYRRVDGAWKIARHQSVLTFRARPATA